ncbi:MAG: PilZ domain-containing protein [Oscillospiraceae bacterium]|nr:PilZ domain-containing protein [Oscillospiraceae bacterium]
MFEKCKKGDIIEKTGALICQARVSVGHSGEVLLVIPRAASYKPNSLYRVVFYDPVLGRVTCRCRLSASLPLPGGELCSLRCEVLEQLNQDYLRAPLLLEKGRRVWFDFQIGGENLTLSAQVLRSENASLNKNQLLYGYGCKFINMLSKHEAALRSFIFQQQRQQRRQE